MVTPRGIEEATWQGVRDEGPWRGKDHHWLANHKRPSSAHYEKIDQSAFIRDLVIEEGLTDCNANWCSQCLSWS